MYLKQNTSMFFGGYGYSSHNQNAQSPPARTSAWGTAYSPFRNTNIPLQDITMSQTLPLLNGTNARSPVRNSPGGPNANGTNMTGSGVGRTMKEYEDQLGALQKENFNLKFRIYFLEERMGITAADEDAIKKNIELKVEIETLRKELLEKQELLSQAAKAFELIEEQKEMFSRNQAQYEQSLQSEKKKIALLEKELEEYRDKTIEASMYYKQAFGITPEKAVENQEKLHQMEELVDSLEAEVKQITASLEEERVWTLELENERDEFRTRLEVEIRSKQDLIAERMRDIEELREKVKEFEEQIVKKDTLVQQCNNEVAEKDRVIREKDMALEEKCRTLEELTVISEKRKRQIDQLRLSVKARDDALTDLNNKHRTLLSQYENGYTKRSPPSSPVMLSKYSRSLSPKLGQKISCIQRTLKVGNESTECDAKKEKIRHSTGQAVLDLSKELEEKDFDLKQQEETKKQLVLKLCNMQKHAEMTDLKLKKLEGEHEKAIKTIQGFMERQQQMEDKYLRKERRVIDLEHELNRLKSYESFKDEKNGGHASLARKDLNNEMVEDPERDHSNQQRFEEMEIKINDLQEQIEIIKAEKVRLEKQIQVDSEELQERLRDKEQTIQCLEIEKHTIKEELRDKITELGNLKGKNTSETVDSAKLNIAEQDELLNELNAKNVEIAEKNKKIEQLNKELQVKTQNLQKLVNTELWNKNKEIAKLHNHMTAASHSHFRSRSKFDALQENTSPQLEALMKELSNIGFKVTFTDDIVHLDYLNAGEATDVKAVTDYVQTLMKQKNDLEKEVDYLKWLKLVTKPDIASEIDGCGDETERARKYCELLRTHLKELVKFMKGMLRNDDHTDTISNEHKKIVLDALVNSKILSDDFVHALEGMSVSDVSSQALKNSLQEERNKDPVRKSRSENLLLHSAKSKHTSTQSDSEAFSEPDLAVSKARIGLQESHRKSLSRSRHSKYSKTFSDSEDSIDYVPYHKTYQTELNDFDPIHHMQELRETNDLLYSGLNALRNDLGSKITSDSTFDEKLSSLITILEKSRKFFERLQTSLEKRTHENHIVKRESKQNSIRKVQLEKKIIDVENMAAEITKQKAELTQYKENTEKKTAEMLITLNKENEMLRSKIMKLEGENEAAKESIAKLAKELDHLTLSHSQILVENTKLTNDKLRLEQEVRKTENRYDVAVRLVHDKFNKEILDLNQINDSHRARVQELEATNKELHRHVAVCEASDSAPSSSGVSSIPIDTTLKQTCEDVSQEYQTYNYSQYWLPITYSTFGVRSKSSCSPDLGIESDAAVTVTRPLQDTLKITESMTNLLSDDDNGNRDVHTVDGESPLPIEGLDEVEVLKQENETLKRRLMKTRRALEDTFQHLSASNKNKKNVEKAITKQLLMTKNILKKTRTYEEPTEN